MSRLYAILIAFSLALAAALPARADKQGAQREDAVTITAQVRAIDYETRQVLLRGDDGSYVEVVAGPEVRNFNQVKLGDLLHITYYEAVAAHIAGADSNTAPSGAIAEGRAAEGEKPGMIAASTMNMVVEFVSYDPESHIATYIDPDGVPGSIVVNPKMRDFAASLEKGDKVDVTVTRALAISMETPPK